MREKRILYGILALAVFFLLANPVMVNAKSNEQVLDGYSYDPGQNNPAFHPEIDSIGSNVVAVYAKETDTYDSNYGGYLPNIKIAISANSGVNWNLREWVCDGTHNKIRDYPDVHVVDDYTESGGGDERIIVVWQEKPSDDSTDWVIKARERTGFGINDPWLDIHTVSIEDNEADKYPKIDTYGQGGDDPKTYWNVVWQHYEVSAGSWSIQLDTYKKDSNGASWMQNDQYIKYPSDSNEEYTHPAIACNYEDSYSCEVHIVYDSYDISDDPDYSIEVTTGKIIYSQPNHIYSSYNPPRTVTIDSASSDSDIGYPDITSRLPDSNSHVCIVWRKSGVPNNQVLFSESFDSGQTYQSFSTVTSTSGPSESLRCVAIAIDEQNGNKISVVWTDDDDIYYRNRTNSNWLPSKQWTNSNDNTEDFVDVSIYQPFDSPTYSHVCWQKNTRTVYYARDP